jgi:hypothetical protein
MIIDAEIINSVYKKYLGREADSEGLRHFGQYDSLVEVERAIVASDEFRRSDLMIRSPNTIVAWKICIIEEAKLIFVPIAKNAHTSILGAFLKLRGINWRELPISDDLINKYGSDDDKIHAILADNNTGLLFKDHSPAFVDSILKSDDYIKVAVFRDPVERIVSACNHFFVQEANNPTALRHSQQVFEAFGNEPDEKNSDHHSERWLRRLMKFLINTKSCDLDPHWMPQYDYVSRLKINHILPMERLDLLEKIVAARSGKHLDIGRLNVRNVKDTASNRAIDKEIRDLIEEFYWIDRKLYDMARMNAGLVGNDFAKI